MKPYRRTTDTVLLAAVETASGVALVVLAVADITII